MDSYTIKGFGSVLHSLVCHFNGIHPKTHVQGEKAKLSIGGLIRLKSQSPMLLIPASKLSGECLLAVCLLHRQYRYIHRLPLHRHRSSMYGRAISLPSSSPRPAAQQRGLHAHLLLQKRSNGVHGVTLLGFI